MQNFSTKLIRMSEMEIDSDVMSEDESSSGVPTGPPPKKRFTGASKYGTKFSSEWKKTWPFILAVPGSHYKFRCSICAKTLSCQHQGVADVKQHIETRGHQRLAHTAASQTTLSLHSTSDPIHEKVS